MFDHTSTYHPRSGTRLAAVLVGLLLFAAACGSDRAESDEAGDSDASATSVDAPTTTATEDDVEGAEGSERTIVTVEDGVTTSIETTTTVGETDESVSPDPTDTDENGIAGEPLDFGPSEGTPLAIVGVAYDDTLNFRVDPSPDAEVLASYGPLSGDLDTSALGSAWAAPSGVWWMVEVAGTTAWANQAFLGSLGNTINAFDQLSAELETLQFDSVEAAALAVAELRSSVDPASEIVFAGEPLLFEIGGFAVVDVMGLGDDAVKGERLRIDVSVVFDEESGEEGGQDVAYVVLADVEITAICGRGVSDGLCT